MVNIKLAPNTVKQIAQAWNVAHVFDIEDGLDELKATFPPNDMTKKALLKFQEYINSKGLEMILEKMIEEQFYGRM